MTPRGTHAAVVHPKRKHSILIYGGYGGSKPSWLCDLIIFHTGLFLSIIYFLIISFILHTFEMQEYAILSWYLDSDTLEWQDLRPEGAKPKGRGYHTFTVFGSYVALFGGKSEGGIVNEEKLRYCTAATLAEKNIIFGSYI